MDRALWKHSAEDRVYRSIKARVIAYDFPQGRRIYLQPIADALGVSTTPVREALNRLAAEDLVIKAPHKGFIAPTLSKDNLLGYYKLTRLLLVKVLEGLDTAARQRLSECKPLATVLYKLNRRVLSDVGTLTAYTEETFLHISSLGENPQVVRSIERASDHLYYIRTIECRYFKNVQSELVLLCELLLARRCRDLLQAIRNYHQKRIAALPALLELAKK